MCSESTARDNRCAILLVLLTGLICLLFLYLETLHKALRGTFVKRRTVRFDGDVGRIGVSVLFMGEIPESGAHIGGFAADKIYLYFKCISLLQMRKVANVILKW